MSIPKNVEPPSWAVASAILSQVAPQCQLVTIENLPGSFSNATHLLVARDSTGIESRYVVRRYAQFRDYDQDEKATREFRTLALLWEQGLPVPRPLYLDSRGDLLGVPGIVTAYIAGRLVMVPSNPIDWAQALAQTLARLHAVPCDRNVQDFLLDANAEALWFLRSESMPDYVAAQPLGPQLWQAMQAQAANLKPVPATLVHIDYWSGNILWADDQILAVIDWEEAAWGDPAIDVAYCRMDMVLNGFDDAAEKFLTAYQAATGRPVANLGFWELAAAVRPMFNPIGWISESPNQERFNRFVSQALAKL